MDLKLGLMTGTFGLCLCCGLLPFSRTLTVNKNYAGVTRCAAGGTMLAVGLVHLLSEGVDNLKNQWAFILTGSSYILMISVFNILRVSHHDTRVLTSDEKTTAPTSLLAVSVLLLSLSVHGVCMGLALGVAATPTAVLSTGLAILSHKWADSLAIGYLLKQTQASLPLCLAYLLLFASITPLAASVGIVLSSANSPTLVGVTASTAAGSLIYMAAQVVREELDEGNTVKFALFVTGFLFFVVITIVLDYIMVHSTTRRDISTSRTYLRLKRI